MKYWTLFYVGGKECQSNGDYYYSHYQHSRYQQRRSYEDVFSVGRASEVSSAAVTRIVESGDVATFEEPVMLALIDPSEEELCKLGNAVIYDSTRFAEFEAAKKSEEKYYSKIGAASNVKLALRPQDYDGFFLPFRSNGEERKRYRYGSSDDSYKIILSEDITVVRDGEIVRNPCSKCDKIIGRAAGKCSPPLKGCTHIFFHPDARITTPDKSLFLPQNKCMEFEAFVHTNPSKLDVGITCCTPLDKGEASRTSAKAAYTRSSRITFCKYCALAVPSGKSYMCSGSKWIKPGRCSGPVFNSEFPIPSNEQRFFINLPCKEIPAELFVEDLSKALIPGVGQLHIPNWRKDPELFFGRYNEYTNAVHIFANRFMRPRTIYVVRWSTFMDFITRHNYRMPDLSTECSCLERVVCWAINSGVVDKALNCNYRFGGPKNTTFTGVHDVYGDKKCYRFDFQFTTCNEFYHVASAADMGDILYKAHEAIRSIPCADGTGASVYARSTNLLNYFNQGGDVKLLRKFMSKAQQAASMGELLPVFDESV